jgi:hypothetical protein
MQVNLRSAITKASTLSLGLFVAIGCSSNANTSSGSDDGAGSEIATSVVSGALNNTEGSKLGLNDLPRQPRPTGVEWILQKLNPIGTAWAATWTCSGGTITPAFSGPGTYAYTPVGCSINWGTGKTPSATWSSSFNLAYGSTCDSTHAFILNQTTNCSVTRTTSASGNTRTLTGPDGSSYSVTHDTNGEGTGWDSSVTPSPTNDGVVATCAAGGCASGLSLKVNGSHLTGTLTPAGGSADRWWDHTVTTGSDGVAVTISGTSRVVSGTVIVQHNLAKFTSTTTFNNVEYGDANCCFPSGGSVTTTFSKGPYQGKTETLSFGTALGCGEATLTKPDGVKVAFTLKHCI